MKNFVQPGDYIDVTLAADILSGAGLLTGSLFGVATIDGLNTETIPVKTTGVVTLPKLSTDTPTPGTKAYWDNTNKRTTTTASGNTLIGCYTATYGSGTTEGNVRLNGTVV